MNVLYVLPLMEMGHRQELLGWTKVLVTDQNLPGTPLTLPLNTFCPSIDAPDAA